MAQPRLRRATSRVISLESLQEALQLEFPTLHAFQEHDRIVVRGSVPIINSGTELDRYVLEIRMADDLSLPEVWEIGNRIPRMSDRHVNPADGSLCLGVPEELWVVWGQSFDLYKYLNGPVRDFLIGNTLIEQGEAWPHGECAHDVEGICAFYDEKFGTSEPIAIYQLLQYLSRERIKGHWGCPCGSGKKLRDCHFRIVLDLHQNLAAPAIRYSLGKLRCHMALEHRLNGTQEKGRPLQRDQSSP